MWCDHTFSRENKTTKKVKGKQREGRQYKWGGGGGGQEASTTCCALITDV